MKSVLPEDEGFGPDVQQHHKTKGTSEILQGPCKRSLEVLKQGYFALEWKRLALNEYAPCLYLPRTYSTIGKTHINNLVILQGYLLFMSKVSKLQ